MQDIAEETGALLTRAIRQARLPSSFDVIVSADPTMVGVDPRALERVVRHLLWRAVAHHDRDRGSITVGVTERGGYVYVSVSDDGPALAPEVRSLACASELWILARLVEERGGKLCVASEPPRGTTVAFTWPQASPVGDPPA